MGEAIERFKRKHEIATTADLVLVFSTFSLAGSTVGFTVRYLLHDLFFALPKVPTWIYIPTYIAVALPIYQGLLLVYGFLLGQFSFFWKRFEKLRSAMGRFFKRRKESFLTLLSGQSRENV